MNRRIKKKKHTNYLSDVGIEVSQDKEWSFRLAKLAVGDTVSIKSESLPESFFNLNPEVSKFSLNYMVARVGFSSIPTSESGWWGMRENTVCLVFYPSEFKKSRWYVAVNLDDYINTEC
ncbi:hypothetical protein [uncultured Microbulbifer sp.]|uniref:hypothetical protein n=1 Tax=uncultured Microbulbifer sp. TaxID=348147 RepID=UPI0026223190|nr:hypothetical protein [uncultured Microbulbifer sp.]